MYFLAGGRSVAAGIKRECRGIRKDGRGIPFLCCLNFCWCTSEVCALFYSIGNCSLCGGHQQEFSQKILARAQAKSVPFFTL